MPTLSPTIGEATISDYAHRLSQCRRREDLPLARQLMRELNALANEAAQLTREAIDTMERLQEQS